MTSIKRLLAVAATLTLTACSSAPPTQYYTLIAPPFTADNAAPPPVGFQFNVQSLRVPVQVDQPQLVIRQGDGTLAILENERWGSPLADEFHDALVARMEQRLGTRDLSGLPRDSERDQLALRMDVRRFESIPGHYALVDAVWSLELRTPNEGRRSLTCSTTVTEASGEGLENVVVAHQRGVTKLADTVSDTARRWAVNPGQECPAAR